MGHMAAMAELCKFVAMHGLVKRETDEQKEARIKEEQIERESEQKRAADMEKYRDFWREQYTRISDESAIRNFEYAISESATRHLNVMAILYDSTPKQETTHLKYPSLHAEIALETHHKAICNRMQYLIKCAFPRGNFAYGKTDEEKRLIRLGHICNTYKHIGKWWL